MRANLNPKELAATLETPRDVELALRNAINSERAIVFVHLDWAIMAPHQQYVRFMLEYYHDIRTMMWDFTILIARQLQMITPS